MKILTASYILTFDENFTILKDGCIVFDEKIIELASYDMTIKKYPNIEIVSLGAKLCFNARTYKLTYSS